MEKPSGYAEVIEQFGVGRSDANALKSINRACR